MIRALIPRENSGPHLQRGTRAGPQSLQPNLEVQVLLALPSTASVTHWYPGGMHVQLLHQPARL